MKFLKSTKALFIIASSLSVAALCMNANAKSTATDAALKQLESQKFSEAAKALSASFEAGDGDAAFYLGRMFELGLGTQVDIKRAAGLYQLSSEKESALGQNRLALIYIRGEAGVLQDYKKAYDILKTAAAKGGADAQFNFASMYEKGWGVKPSDDEAFKWFQKAAANGHIGAQNKVALAYREGKGVKKDVSKALDWFAKSASQNNPLGLYEMAHAFEKGEHRSQQSGKAYMLFNLAAAAGLKQAALRRDQITLALNSDELNKFQEKARKWVDQQPKDRLKLLKQGA